MIDESDIDFLKNNPMYLTLLAAGVLVFVFAVFKFVFGSKSTRVSKRSVEAPSKSGKKKKAKKQKVISQDRKSSESAKTRRDIKSSEASTLLETKKEIYAEKSDKRKDGSKSKAKSKKKKNLNQLRNEAISEPALKEVNFDDDGWKTVSTKEQRDQLRREKKKLEEEHTLSVESAVSENAPLVNISYKPIHNPAIAKGIAPRFARAAGAEWQEKPTTQPALQSKRPMPRATVPGIGKTQANSTTVTQQTWNQGNQPWQEALGWSVSNAPTLTPNLLSYHSPDASKLLALTRPGDKNAPDMWPEGGVSWQSSGSRTSNSSWDINGEDWVHVHGQTNGSNNKPESWPANEQVQVQTPAVELSEPAKAGPVTDIRENPKTNLEEPKEDWSVPKASKKRKPRARKAD